MPSPRHTNEIMTRLEHVIDRGFAEFSDKELRRWYGQDRIGVNVWRDIHERWMELHQDPHAETSVMTAGTGYGYIFARGDGLSTNGTYWVELYDRAREPVSDHPLYQKIADEFRSNDPPMTAQDAVDRWGYSGGHTRRVMDWMSDRQQPPILRKLPGVSPIQWERNTQNDPEG